MVGRPTKEQQFLKDERNKKIVSMRKAGYPVTFIAGTFGLTKSRTSRIIKKLLTTT